MLADYLEGHKARNLGADGFPIVSSYPGSNRSVPTPKPPRPCKKHGPDRPNARDDARQGPEWPGTQNWRAAKVRSGHPPWRAMDGKTFAKTRPLRFPPLPPRHPTVECRTLSRGLAPGIDW